MCCRLAVALKKIPRVSKKEHDRLVRNNIIDVFPTSVSNAGDVTVTSSSQNEGLYINYSTPTNKDPPEGKTSAVIAVMRGELKDGYHCHRSNKHCKQNLVRVLLDSCSDSELVFVSKGKPILLPYSKRLFPQSLNTSNGIFQTKHEARVELNFFEYSANKRYYSEPAVVKYENNNKPQYDLILGTKTMKELDIVLDLTPRWYQLMRTFCQWDTSTFFKALAQYVR
jgi:hypothetical protein